MIKRSNWSEKKGKEERGDYTVNSRKVWAQPPVLFYDKKRGKNGKGGGKRHHLSVIDVEGVGSSGGKESQLLKL